MAIPKYHELFADVLRALRDGRVRRVGEVIREVADGLGLSEAERTETMSGGRNRAESRVHWASVSLKEAGAIARPKRGFIAITPFGKELLLKFPGGVPLSALEETEGLQAWYVRSRESHKAKHSAVKADEGPSSSDSDQSPEELIALASLELSNSVAAELLDLLHAEDPEFLEHAVLTVLHAMGYGSSVDDLQHLGGTGDGGVDGVINQDRLGLDQIYVQAKRHQSSSSIGRPEVQAFAGAVVGKKASRGIYITTSRFGPHAREYASDLKDPRLILLDGEEFTNLMIKYEVGVTVDKTYKVYRIDENFFGADD